MNVLKIICGIMAIFCLMLFIYNSIVSKDLLDAVFFGITVIILLLSLIGLSVEDIRNFIKNDQ